VQEAIYICNLGSKDEERKKEILVMSEAIDEEDAEVGECQNYNLVKNTFYLPCRATVLFIGRP